jgi:hypothetical protein
MEALRFLIGGLWSPVYLGLLRLRHWCASCVSCPVLLVAAVSMSYSQASWEASSPISIKTKAAANESVE